MQPPHETPPAAGEQLSHEAVRELIARARAGDGTARTMLIEANLRLVSSIARRFSHRADPDDLFQAGCLGLMQAIDRFDLNYDVRFSTYAVPLIMAEIHRYLRENHPVKVSRHGLDLARRAADAREALERELGRAPTPHEIGERIGAPREEVVAALDAVAVPSSLNERLDDEGGDTRLDHLRSPHGVPEESVVDGMALRAALDRLDATERQVLIWRFVEERRQVEVARLLGVSQAHVSRFERRVLKKVRDFLTA